VEVVVRPIGDAPVFDPRTGVRLPKDPSPAVDEAGAPVHLAEARGTAVPWTSPWKRRYVAGEIEIYEDGRWRRFRDSAVTDPATEEE